MRLITSTTENISLTISMWSLPLRSNTTPAEEPICLHKKKSNGQSCVSFRNTRFALFPVMPPQSAWCKNVLYLPPAAYFAVYPPNTAHNLLYSQVLHKKLLPSLDNHANTAPDISQIISLAKKPTPSEATQYICYPQVSECPQLPPESHSTHESQRERNKFKKIQILDVTVSCQRLFQAPRACQSGNNEPNQYISPLSSLLSCFRRNRQRLDVLHRETKSVRESPLQRKKKDWQPSTELCFSLPYSHSIVFKLCN